jgi:hypothetical protein
MPEELPCPAAAARRKRRARRRKRKILPKRRRPLPSAKIFNGAKLAFVMDVSPSFVLAMKRAGYQFTHGHQTTLASALKWRAAFPRFRAYVYLEKGWQNAPKLRLRTEEFVFQF